MLIQTRVEAKRGCGYRTAKPGEVRLYFVGEPFNRVCDMLPWRLDECPVCGGGVHQFRGTKWINPRRLFGGEVESPTGLALKRLVEAMEGELPLGPDAFFAWKSAQELLSIREGCSADGCSRSCPFHTGGMPEKAILMWVGKGSGYPTAESFLREASERGISKRINRDSLPRDWKPGDIVYLAHPLAVMPWHAAWKDPVEAEEHDDIGFLEGGTEKKVSRDPQPGVFATFRPRLEVVVSTTNPDELPQYVHTLAEKFGEDISIIKVIPLDDSVEQASFDDEEE